MKKTCWKCGKLVYGGHDLHRRCAAFHWDGPAGKPSEPFVGDDSTEKLRTISRRGTEAVGRKAVRSDLLGGTPDMLPSEDEDE